MSSKKINSKIFGAKYRTIGEMEKIMRSDLKYMLCDSKHLNSYFYRALANGSKSKIFNSLRALKSVTIFNF
jgi:ribosomal protein L19E